MHTHHLLDGVPIDLVRLVSVMAKTACVKSTTAWCFDLRLARVVSTSHDARFLILGKHGQKNQRRLPQLEQICVGGVAQRLHRNGVTTAKEFAYMVRNSEIVLGLLIGSPGFDVGHLGAVGLTQRRLAAHQFLRRRGCRRQSEGALAPLYEVRATLRGAAATLQDICQCRGEDGVPDARGNAAKNHQIVDLNPLRLLRAIQ